MPIFEYECNDCGGIFESIEVWTMHIATECKLCKGKNIQRIIGTPHVRMDSDAILKSLPDPTPPLRELIGKTKPGCEGGYKELEQDQRQLKDYIRRRDKMGNAVFLPKERRYFDYGARSSNRKKKGEG